MKALLTSKEAGQYLGYSEQAINTSRGDGKTLGGISPPKHTKIGNKTIRYKLKELDKWIESLGE